MNSNTVALLEAIYPSAAVNQLLSASEERMALAADFDLELTLGRAGNEGLTASAAHHCFAIRRMNIFLHVLSLLCRVMHYRRILYHSDEKMQAVFFDFSKLFFTESPSVSRLRINGRKPLTKKARGGIRYPPLPHCKEDMGILSNFPRNCKNYFSLSMRPKRKKPSCLFFLTNKSGKKGLFRTN